MRDVHLSHLTVPDRTQRRDSEVLAQEKARVARWIVFEFAEDPVSKALVEGAGLIAEGVQVGMPATTFSGGGFDGEDQAPPEPLAPLGLGHPHRVDVEPIPVGTAVGAAEDMLRRVATEYGQRLKAGGAGDRQGVGAEPGFENGDVFPGGSRLYRDVRLVHELFLLSN